MSTRGTELSDVREEIFRSCRNKTVIAALVSEDAGIVSGVNQAGELAMELGLTFTAAVTDGTAVETGSEIARVVGEPIQIAKAEEVLIGVLSKASGIATRARKALTAAGTNLRVVSGGWKKMPPEMRMSLRQAVKDGGLESRISDRPFIYLDKNYVRILGGIEEAISAVVHLNRPVVIQIRGETAPIDAEAVQAARSGAAILMIDTGAPEHGEIVHQGLVSAGLRDRVQLAFAGNVSVDHLGNGHFRRIQIVDIGYDILDAPALPIRFDVVEVS